MTVCYHLFNWPEGTGRASAAVGASFPPLTSAQDLLASSSQRLEPIPRTPPCKVQSSSSSPTSLQWVRVTLMLQRQELGSQILEATARHFFTISPWDTRSKVRTLESCLFGKKKCFIHMKTPYWPIMDMCFRSGIGFKCPFCHPVAVGPWIKLLHLSVSASSPVTTGTIPPTSPCWKIKWWMEKVLCISRCLIDI